MDSEHELIELHDRVHRLEAITTACRAALATCEPDYRGRCRTAASELHQLLDLPHQRPGSWEAGPISQLADELRDVLHELEGDDERLRTAARRRCRRAAACARVVPSYGFMFDADELTEGRGEGELLLT